jgi:hypothetical protein
MTSTDTSETPWAKGRFGLGRRARVLFGAMYEDPSIDLQAVEGRANVLCICSAADTAKFLANNGHNVTAVDINPAQVAYAKQRLAGRPYQRGLAEVLMAIGRTVLRPVGWSRRELTRFCTATDIEVQRQQWHQLTHGARGLGFRVLLSPSRLRLGYKREFVDVAGKGFADRVFAIVDRSLVHVPNADNPYASLLFLGQPLPDVPLNSDAQLTVLCADVVKHLLSVPEHHYDAVTLSNILDGASQSFHDELRRALQHGAKPDAPVVLRTFKAVSDEAATIRASNDRSLIWSAIWVTTPGDF